MTLLMFDPGTIPGIFTYKRVGEELARAEDNGTIVEMQIRVGETCTRALPAVNR